MLSSKQKGIDVYSFLSDQTENLLLYSDKIGSISRKIFYTTDDGSEYAKGKVTNLLEKVLKETIIDFVYTCGLKRLTQHIKNYKRNIIF